MRRVLLSANVSHSKTSDAHHVYHKNFPPVTGIMCYAVHKSVSDDKIEVCYQRDEPIMTSVLPVIILSVSHLTCEFPHFALDLNAEMEVVEDDLAVSASHLSKFHVHTNHP